MCRRCDKNKVGVFRVPAQKDAVTALLDECDQVDTLKRYCQSVFRRSLARHATLNYSLFSLSHTHTLSLSLTVHCNDRVARRKHPSWRDARMRRMSSLARSHVNLVLFALVLVWFGLVWFVSFCVQPKRANCITKYFNMKLFFCLCSNFCFV